MTKNNAKEPLIHISKRGITKPWQPIVTRAIAIVGGLFLGLCFASIYTKVDPFSLLGKMFFGSFGKDKFVWNLLQEVAILLLISLAVVPAFKMKYWNIGADGQTLVGCLASAIAVYYWHESLPNWALLIVMLLFGVTAGMIWAVIPALFKAKWNTNETLFTLMMNYIAIQLVKFVLLEWFPSGQNDFSKFYRKFGNLPILGNKYVLILIFAGILTTLMALYLSKTKHGFEVSLVGESVNTSKYVGINVKKVILRTMLLSGAICGFAGFLLVAAKDHNISTEMVGGRGFTAIIVVWLAKFNPVYMILTALLVAFLSRGTQQISSTTGITDSSLSNIITALVFFFVIGCEFFVTYKVHFRPFGKKAKLPPSDIAALTAPPEPAPPTAEEPEEKTTPEQTEGQEGGDSI